MMKSLTELRKREFEELRNLFGDSCISYEEVLGCYGKPCACLVCSPIGFCVDHPCVDCGGKEEDRTYEFCMPSEEGLEEYENNED